MYQVFLIYHRCCISGYRLIFRLIQQAWLCQSKLLFLQQKIVIAIAKRVGITNICSYALGLKDYHAYLYFWEGKTTVQRPDNYIDKNDITQSSFLKKQNCQNTQCKAAFSFFVPMN